MALGETMTAHTGIEGPLDALLGKYTRERLNLD